MKTIPTQINKNYSKTVKGSTFFKNLNNYLNTAIVSIKNNEKNVAVNNLGQAQSEIQKFVKSSNKITTSLSKAERSMLIKVGKYVAVIEEEIKGKIHAFSGNKLLASDKRAIEKTIKSFITNINLDKVTIEAIEAKVELVTTSTVAASSVEVEVISDEAKVAIETKTVKATAPVKVINATAVKLMDPTASASIVDVVSKLSKAELMKSSALKIQKPAEKKYVVSAKEIAALGFLQNNSDFNEFIETIKTSAAAGKWRNLTTKAPEVLSRGWNGWWKAVKTFDYKAFGAKQDIGVGRQIEKIQNLVIEKASASNFDAAYLNEVALKFVFKTINENAGNNPICSLIFAQKFANIVNKLEQNMPEYAGNTELYDLINATSANNEEKLYNKFAPIIEARLQNVKSTGVDVIKQINDVLVKIKSTANLTTQELEQALAKIISANELTKTDLYYNSIMGNNLGGHNKMLKFFQRKVIEKVINNIETTWSKNAASMAKAAKVVEILHKLAPQVAVTKINAMIDNDLLKNEVVKYIPELAANDFVFPQEEVEIIGHTDMDADIY